jgi:hypothetical protein
MATSESSVHGRGRIFRAGLSSFLVVLGLHLL